MLSSKKRKSPTNIKESLNDNADRFYKMFRIHTTAKVAMSLIAMTAVGFSFYNLYEQWQDAEGKKDHIAVIRISGEMGTGSEIPMLINAAGPLSRKDTTRNPPYQPDWEKNENALVARPLDRS